MNLNAFEMKAQRLSEERCDLRSLQIHLDGLILPADATVCRKRDYLEVTEMGEMCQFPHWKHNIVQWGVGTRCFPLIQARAQKY